MTAKSPVYLFLDFDGVLHYRSMRIGVSEEENAFFRFLPRLEGVLRDYSDVLVVVSSDWRAEYSLDELREFFSEDIRPRVISTTNRGRTPERTPGARQREIEAYLAAQGLSDARWVALDDNAENFDAEAPLVLCPDEFGESEEALLRERLAGLISSGS